MLDIDKNRLLLNLFQEDINENHKNTYISQLALITIKSLLPSSKLAGNIIDYRRFNKELKLWKYYKLGQAGPLEEMLEELNVENYFARRDKTIICRIIPIVLANRDSQLIEEEIIKNILNTSGNIRDLLEGLLVGKFINGLINKSQIEEGLKDFLINFGQADYLDKFKDLYRLSIENYPGNYSISFEKERVSLLSILNGVDLDKYNQISDLLGLLKGKKPTSFLGKIVFNTMEGHEITYSLDQFYLDMNNYLFRLRKSRIDPKRLVIKDYILPDVFSFEENQVFFHSLLNHCKVIKKEVRNNQLTSLIQTKTGMYTFKRDLI